jgi:hypothetical protein
MFPTNLFDQFSVFPDSEFFIHFDKILIHSDT